MDSATMPAMGTTGKKQVKAKKLAKDLTPEKRRAESDKRAGRRGAARGRAAAAKLEEARLKANERIIARRAEANSELLAKKATR
jgi:hypothetical protein